MKRIVLEQAVDRAVDHAAVFIIGGPGARAQGQGPNWPLGTQGPHPKPHGHLRPKPHILWALGPHILWALGTHILWALGTHIPLQS